MSIITLTTDLGTRDYYIGAVKGTIFSQLADIKVVDISHEITPFDIREAAYILKNAFGNFPRGTIHIVGVNSTLGVSGRHLIATSEGHHFVCGDNGLLSLLFDRLPDKIFELTMKHESDILTFPLRTVFAQAACHLARGGTPEVIGREINDPVQLENFRAVREEDMIKASVIYIDRYGNAILNVDRALFKEVGRGRDFAIVFRKASLDIRKIHANYDEVGDGQGVAIFNHAGNLELAVNKGAEGSGGGASSLFGLKINALIRIEFNARQNR